MTLTPGTLLGIEGATDTIFQYSQTGTILDTLVLGGITGTPTGLSVVGSSVYVSDTSRDVRQVNLTTGATTLAFNDGAATNNEGLGNIGSDLLTMNFADTVRRYTATGTLVSTITMIGNSGGAGIESDGSVLFMASFNTGVVSTHSLTGTLLSSFNAGAGTSSLSALGFDQTDGTLWVASGFGDDRIRGFNSSGTLLADFAAGSSFINGLDVVPLPEPTTALLLAYGLVGLGVRRRRH